MKQQRQNKAKQNLMSLARLYVTNLIFVFYNMDTKVDEYLANYVKWYINWFYVWTTCHQTYTKYTYHANIPVWHYCGALMKHLNEFEIFSNAKFQM